MMSRGDFFSGGPAHVSEVGRLDMAKVKVPEGMLKAALESKFGCTRETMCLSMLEAALKWLSENPIVPTDEQIAEMKTELAPVNPHWGNIVATWQRRMFLQQEDEVPEAIIDLLDNWAGTNPKVNAVQRDLIEAYRRGKESK